MSVQVNLKIFKSKKKQKGILTIDFIFSILAIYAISMVFVLLALTLMFSTITQYVAFSVSRAHISGHIDRVQQEETGVLQYQNIMGQSGISALLKVTDGGWFKVELQEPVGQELVSGFSSDAGAGRQKGYGVQIRYTSNILKNFKLPMIGSPSDGAEGDFAQANINSFLYREPTTIECLNFNRTRWRVLEERLPQITTMPDYDSSKAYGDSADNGC